MVEVMEICPSYGLKLNPKRKFSDIVASSGKELKEWVRQRPPFPSSQGKKVDNLFDSLPKIPKDFQSTLDKPLSIILSGSAGEGVQLAAGIISKAAIRSRLFATQKGSYPVTVGVGFSTAEINLSPEEIYFHGIGVPDIAIITSQDGLEHSKKRVEAMKQGTLYIDSSLPIPSTKANIVQYNFRESNPRDASLLSIFYFAKKTNIVPVDALIVTLEEEGKSSKSLLEKIEKI